MNKLFILPLIALGLLASVAVANALDGDEAGASWPHAHVLGVGEAVGLPDGSALEFVRLVEDSRCPADAMCAWQGQAVVRLALDGAQFDVTFTGPDSASVVVGDVAVAVRDVQPYPVASVPQDPADKEITVSVKPVE